MQKLVSLILVFVLMFTHGCVKKISHAGMRERDSYTFADGAKFKLPPTWSVHENDGYVTVSGPEPGLYVYVIETPRVKSLEDEAVKLWKMVKPNFSYPVLLKQTVPTARGFEDIETVIFDVPTEESRSVLAAALTYQNRTHWLLIQANNDLLSRRNAELMLIIESFRAAGMPDDTVMT